jgi:hypothetical protein
MRTVGKVENKIPTEPIVYEYASLLIYVGPALICHHLTAKARERCLTTSLRSIVVLSGLQEYASARQPSPASY